MRLLIIFLLVVLSTGAFSTNFAVILEHVGQNETIISQPTIVTLKITETSPIIATSQYTTTISEEIPETWIITDWQIKNYNYSDITYSKNASTYSWTFTKPFSGQLNLTYTLVPVDEGKKKLTAKWVWDGVTRATSDFWIEVKNITSPTYCGNLICEKGEDWIICQKDCMFICDRPCQITIVLGIIALIALGMGLRKIKIRRRI